LSVTSAGSRSGSYTGGVLEALSSDNPQNHAQSVLLEMALNQLQLFGK
jgi:hypothetical protein